MGTWSADILGSDDALDTLHTLGQEIELGEDISLYPLPQDRETIVLVEQALHKHKGAILSAGWSLEAWPIIAAVYMATGAIMPQEVIVKAMHACYVELRSLKTNRDDWDNPDERVAVLKKFIDLIDAHEPGKITNIEYKGLFQTMTERHGS